MSLGLHAQAHVVPFCVFGGRFKPQELTYIIKQDIAALNQQILQLQQITKNTLNAAASKQVSEHNNNVVVMLQQKLAETSIGFKDVLEIRTQVRLSRSGHRCGRCSALQGTRRLTRLPCSSRALTALCSQNMKASRDRTEQFMYTGGQNASPSSGTSTLSLYCQFQSTLTPVGDLCTKSFVLALRPILPLLHYVQILLYIDHKLLLRLMVGKVKEGIMARRVISSRWISVDRVRKERERVNKGSCRWSWRSSRVM